MTTISISFKSSAMAKIFLVLPVFYGNPHHSFQITESQSPDGQTSRYYYDPAGRLMAVDRDGSRYYVAADQLGTPKLVTDNNGSIIKMLQYDSYGNIINDSAPDFYLPVGFAGGLADDSAGLVRFGFRDYDPIAGRWTAKDPILYQSGQGNLYVYNGNNPVEFKDPSGLKASPCQDDKWSFTDNYRLHYELVDDGKLRIIKAIDPSIDEKLFKKMGVPGKILSTYFVGSDIYETWQNGKYTTIQKVEKTGIIVAGDAAVPFIASRAALAGSAAGPWGAVAGGTIGLVVGDKVVSAGQELAYEKLDLD